MHITIAERLRPFTHLPGTLCMLPGSSYRLEIFPARLRVYDISMGEPKLLTEASFSFRGPVKQFLVQQDLEKGAVQVTGHSSEGYFHYTLKAIVPEGISLWFEKSPPGISWEIIPPFPLLIDEGQTPSVFIPPQTDRLSLGSHKSQDWEMVRRRGSPEEIFPAWLRLGQLVPSPANHQLSGSANWLNECKEGLEQPSPEKILIPFLNLFYSGFEGILSPRLIDHQHQGLNLSSDPIDLNASPLTILTEGAKLIRRLFVIYTEKNLFFLPHLPTEFHCGRLINVKLGEIGILHLEWSKKMLRRAIITAISDGEIKLNFQKDLRSFRVRSGLQAKGIRSICPSNLEIKRGNVYFLDNFQK